MISSEIGSDSMRSTASCSDNPAGDHRADSADLADGDAQVEAVVDD